MKDFSEARDQQRQEIQHLKKENPGFKALAQILERLPGLEEHMPVEFELPPGDLEDMFRQGEVLGDLFPPRAEGADLEKRWAQVATALSGEPLSLEPGVLKKLESPGVDVIQDYFRDLPKSPEETALDLSMRTGVPVDVATLVLIFALGPFYRSWAREVDPGDDLLKLWPSGECPICGARPHFGRLEPEVGARHLECWLCGIEWEFPRLECPYCRNIDQEKLGLFSLEGAAERRVHFCRECGSYLKIIDCRSLGREPVLYLSNLATLILDLAAAREGFGAGSGLSLAGETPDTRGE